MKARTAILHGFILLAFVSACSGSQASNFPQPLEATEAAPTSPATNSPQSGAPASTPTKPLAQNPGEMVTFTTTDSVNLAGTLFGQGDTAVILAHQGTPGADQTTWQPFAHLLAERGYTALTFDFRGVGQSEGELGYGKLARDVSAAVQFLQGRGYQHIVCAGASMGGTACILAAQDFAFTGVILLASTMMAGSGMDSMHLTPDGLKTLTQPKLFIAADGDRSPVVADTKHMYELSPNPKDLLLLPGTQHGTDLFNTDAGEELSAAMLRFIDVVDHQAIERLPALQPITTANAAKVQLLRTLEIPGYQRGQLSQCSLAFSPDGRLLVGACGKNPVPVWDVQSGFLLRSLYDSSEQIVACTFSPDGSQIACGGFDDTVTLWETNTGRKIGSFEGHTAPIWELAFDLAAMSLASCSLGLLGGGTGGGDVRLWDVPNGELDWSYAGTRDYLSVSFDPSGKTLAFGSIGGAVGILDAATGKLILELTDSSRNIGDVTYSPSGHWLAAGSDDDRIYLWDASNYALSAQFTGHTGYVNGVAFNPDESLLASGSHDKTVGLWDLRNQERIAALKGHQDAALRVAFSPDGTLLASISWDGNVRLWGVADGIPAATPVPPTETAIPTEQPPTPEATASPPLSFSLEKSAQTFTSRETVQVGLGDLDGDGDLDAVFANPQKNAAQVWLNDGRGHFTDTGQELTQYGHGVGLADLDGDGDLDAFIVCHQPSASIARRTSSLVYLNAGDGQFQDSGQDFGDAEFSAVEINLLDVDRDGDLDAHVVYFDFDGLPDKVYLNDGAGVFTDSGLALPEDTIAWGDLDGDRDVDYFGKQWGTGYTVQLNDGNGLFHAGWRLDNSQSTVGGVALADLDGDGDLDALVTNGFRDTGSYPSRLFWNDGEGGLSDSGQNLNATMGAELATGDLDNDGDLDLFVANMDRPNEVWLNDGVGNFVDSGLRLGKNADLSGRPSLGDLDGDGDLDVVVGRFQGGAEVWINTIARNNGNASELPHIGGAGMLHIPGVSFQMGSTLDEVEEAIALCQEHYNICNRWYYKRENPQHTVTLDEFWIDQTEVTNAQYRRCVEAGICPEPSVCKKGEPTFDEPSKADHPVVCVNWEEAQTYCQWAGARLPTEAEWEYAFRGEVRAIYPWGNEFDGSLLNYCDANCSQPHADERFDDGYSLTAPVGSYPQGASWSGVLDMGGNVSEWVSDWLGDYTSESVSNPTGPSTGTEKLLKGCSWFSHPTYCRGALRASVDPNTRFDYLGFRCATSVNPETEGELEMLHASINLPLGNPPTIDGTHAPGEWEAATVETFADGSTLLLMRDETYLYLGIRAMDPGLIAGNVFLQRGDEITIMHASAALGTAIYQREENDTWQQTQDFTWQCRDTSLSDAAQAERAAFLQQEGWVAANGLMGTPNELEYQIKIPEGDFRLAVVYLKASPPYDKVPWPEELIDGTVRPTSGGFPLELQFSPESWGLIATNTGG